MKKAVIYARFSSDLQREESIDAQIRACKEYAARNELHILSVYADEAVSGRTANRAQYQKLLRDAQKHGFDVILIHKYDRIGRNLGEHVNLAARLESWGVQLVSVSQDFGDSAEAKIMRTLRSFRRSYLAIVSAFMVSAAVKSSSFGKSPQKISVPAIRSFVVTSKAAAIFCIDSQEGDRSPLSYLPMKITEQPHFSDNSFCVIFCFLRIDCIFSPIVIDYHLKIIIAQIYPFGKFFQIFFQNYLTKYPYSDIMYL